ncbi:MAG: hypothetical protein NTZ55_04400, partial [Candidatus Roizmanbacteria bacterium]|nr:hypothetical protein [Candidatus Roizmanbacteria bacterium]
SIEDEIKSLFPQSYSGIMKSVIYSKSYYSFVRDQAMGDSESADYKWSKLNEDGINLSFDINTLLNEGSDKDMLLNKKIISILDENVSLTNSLYKSLLSKNIFGKIGGFIDNPVACTTYISKVGFYNDLTKKYPSAKTIDDLISELSEIAPTTENLDLLFKRSTMSYINNKDMIKFICIDHINKKEYKFVISK